MARNLTPLMSAKDEQEFGIMPLRPSTPSTSPPLNQSAKSPLSNVFKPSGYEHLHLDDRDDIGSPQPDNGPSSPQASTNSLGIYPDEKIRTSSVRRKPVEPKSPEITSASEAASPDSNCHLLDSPLSLDGRSARPPTWSGIRIPGIAEKLWSWSRTTLPGHRPTATSGQSGPTNNNSSSSLDPDTEIGDHGTDDDIFYRKYSEPPTLCDSREDIGQSRSIVMMIVVLYSAVMSGLWFIVACIQPRWGHKIHSTGSLEPSTATTLTTLFAKSIEISFVASFAWCAGQQLTRRAYRKDNGLILAEICMKGWINQPGAWFQNWEALWYGGRSIVTLRTMLMFLATLGATFYTPASDAMVSPKLKFGDWDVRKLSGPVYTSYANARWLKQWCPAMVDVETRKQTDTESCLNVQLSGASYSSMMGFMGNWTDRFNNGTFKENYLKGRPAASLSLYENVTMEATWIEAEHGNVTANFEKYGRIINNVTMALPHPGVYAAAMFKDNKILQPSDLGGTGQYSIRAGVVSPSVNVMCVNIDAKEIDPLVYTSWPNSRTKPANISDQILPFHEEDWQAEVPPYLTPQGEAYYLNSTILDDIFKWGAKYKRRPPVFSAFPNKYNFISNGTVRDSDAIYLLGKSPYIANYTLCEARSWLSPACSTIFEVTGTQGWTMKAHCEDPNDKTAYHRSFPNNQSWSPPDKDWKFVADEWRKSLDLNGGLRNSNSSNANILTKTILQQPELRVDLPSMGEMLAVLLASTAALGAIQTPFVHYWEYTTAGNILQNSVLQTFNASVRSQEYTSGHIHLWQGGVWYPVLGVVFVLNCLCFAYIWVHAHTLTDFTESENLFTLAINSPPSSQFNGSCGGGPKRRDYVVPWKISYAEKKNHYYFEAANDRPWKGRYSKNGRYSSGDTPELAGDKYKRFSTSKVWV